MSELLILTDTRQQKESHIIKVFDKKNIPHIQTKLESADYMAIRYDIDRGIYKDFTTLIDTKKDLLEVCNNLCHSDEHARVVREVELAHELGCKNFIFLIGDSKIKSVDDIKNWSSKHTKVKGETLLKVMNTFKNHHDCKFIICNKKDMGEKVISLLSLTK